MKTAVATICLFISFYAPAQATFFNQYFSENNIFISGSAELSTGFVSAGVDRTADNPDRGVLTFVSKSGELKDRILIDSHASVCFTSIISLHDFLYVAGLVSEVGETNQKCLWKFDKQGVLIWEEPFGEPATILHDNESPKLCSTQNGILVASSAFDQTFGTQASVTKFDLEGHLLWEKWFTHEQNVLYNDVFVKAAPSKDGTILIMKSTYDPIPFLPNPEMVKWYIIKIDWNGSEIWRKQTTDISFGALDIPDTENVLAGISSTSENEVIAIYCSENKFGISEQLILAYYDQNGELLNAVSTLANRDIDLYDLAINQDDEFYIFGLDNTNFGTNTQLELLVAKLTKEGVLEWEHTYGYENSSDLWSGGIIARDGGILTGGSKFRWSPPFGYDHFLVKTNCKGNFETDQGCPLDSNFNLTIYPNPASSTFIIEIPTNEQLDIELIDLAGRRVAFYSQVSTYDGYQFAIPSVLAGQYQVKITGKTQDWLARLVIF
jgi:Secretion system C-terminal sorting domain